MSDLFRYPDRATSTNERWTNCWNKLCRQNLATLFWEIVHHENTKLVQPLVHVWRKNHTNSKARNNIRNTDKNYRKISNIVAKMVHSAWFFMPHTAYLKYWTTATLSWITAMQCFVQCTATYTTFHNLFTTCHSVKIVLGIKLINSRNTLIINHAATTFI